MSKLKCVEDVGQWRLPSRTKSLATSFDIRCGPLARVCSARSVWFDSRKKARFVDFWVHQPGTLWLLMKYLLNFKNLFSKNHFCFVQEGHLCKAVERQHCMPRAVLDQDEYRPRTLECAAQAKFYWYTEIPNFLISKPVLRNSCPKFGLCRNRLSNIPKLYHSCHFLLLLYLCNAYWWLIGKLCKELDPIEY
jgi:hypothetical protein